MFVIINLMRNIWFTSWNIGKGGTKNLKNNTKDVLQDWIPEFPNKIYDMYVFGFQEVVDSKDILKSLELYFPGFQVYTNSVNSQSKLRNSPVRTLSRVSKKTGALFSFQIFMKNFCNRVDGIFAHIAPSV